MTRLSLVLLLTSVAGATSYNCETYSLPGTTVSVTGLNNSGTVAGTYSTAGGIFGFTQNPGTGNFTTITWPGAVSTQLFAINNNGVALGEASFTNSSPVWFTVDLTDTFQVITIPEYSLVAAYGINDNGAISMTVQVNGNPGGGAYIGTSFAILNPDNTLSLVPGYPNPSQGAQNLPGSINTTPLMLESDHSYGTSALAGPNGTPVQILYPYPLQVESRAFAFGLNNAGTVAGAFELGPDPGDGPNYGFTRDSSGAYSEAFCPGVSLNPGPGFYWQAINDNGFLAGSNAQVGTGAVYYIASPLAGEPQLTLSTSSITFPATIIGQTTSPVNVTLTNTGTSRLDIQNLTVNTGIFTVSGCVTANGTASLAAGASCTLTVTAKPLATTTASGNIVINDSAPGGPRVIALSVTGAPTPPPGCQVSAILPGPPIQVNFTATDTNSGLSSVLLLNSTNAQVNIPQVMYGTTSPVVSSATQVTPGQVSSVNLQVTNVAGSSTTCGTSFGGGSQFMSLGGWFTSRVAIATNSDGRLEAFVRGGDNALWHNWETSPGGVWSGWSSLGGGVLTGDPVVGRNASGTLQVFIPGTDQSVYTTTQISPTPTWTDWTTLGGTVVSNLTVGTNADGRLELFGIGTDHALWHTWQTTPNGSWTPGWTSLGGVIVNNPVVASNADGRLEVFAAGSDNNLWHIWQTTPGTDWSAWAALPGVTITGDAAIGLNANGDLDAFVTGPGNALWHITQGTGGVWGPWTSLSGAITSNPAVTPDNNGLLEAFAAGGDGALWYIMQTSPGGPWSAWTLLGGTVIGQLAVTTESTGSLDVFARSTDNALWHIVQPSPGTWQ